MTKEILTDSRGRATGVAYYSENDHLVEQSADIVVVSCGANESARLLLNSKTRLFPNGLGNRYDWVGRNLQGHAYTGAWGLFDFEVYDDVGPGASIAICDFNHGNSGLIGGARRKVARTGTGDHASLSGFLRSPRNGIGSRQPLEPARNERRRSFG